MKFSSLADPPITPEETAAAGTAICRMHDGLLKYGRTLQDRDGSVYFCPVGGSFWRLSSSVADVNQLPALSYGWRP